MLTSLIQSTQSNNIRAYWKCDETNGLTLADSSGKNQPLALFGAPILSADGITFNGTSQYAARNESVLGPILPEEFSLFMRVRGAPQDLTFLMGLCSVNAGGSAVAIGSGASALSQSINSLRGVVINDAGAVPVGLSGHESGKVLNNQWHSVAFVRRNGAYTLYIDGVLDSAVAAPQGTVTLSNTALGALLRDVPSGFGAFSMGDVAVWDSALTQSEIKALNKAAFPLVTKQVIFDGDSLEMGQGSTQDKDYPTQSLVLLSPTWKGNNFGVGGQTISQMSDDAAVQVDVFYDSDLIQNIVVAGGGINDIYYGVNANDVILRKQTYCAARRAVGFKVGVTTLTPAKTVVGTAEAERVAFNSMLRATWSDFADFLIDFDADERLQNNFDATYYDIDGTHNNDAGYAVRAEIFYLIIQNLFENIQPPVLVSPEPSMNYPQLTSNTPGVAISTLQEGGSTGPRFNLVTTAGNRATFDTGTSFTTGLIAHLHAIYGSGGGRSLSVKLQHSADGSSGWTDLVTFDTLTKSGSQGIARVTLPKGTLIRRYIRPVVTSITGSWAFTAVLSPQGPDI